MDDRVRAILLVEDDAIIAMMERKELESRGYRVHHALTGEEAVKTVVEEGLPLDLILMDIDLGRGIDGTEAAERILERRDIPVVFLSSHTEPEVVERTERITSYGYVVKNSGSVVLEASIKMALRLHAANHALGESEERYKTIVSSMSDLIFVINKEDRFIDLHCRSVDLLLLSREEFMGKKMAAVMPAHVNELYRACAARVRLSGESQRYEYSLPIKGETRWFVASLDLHADGRRLVAGIRDITDRKMMEEELAREGEKYRSLVENLNDVIYTLDARGTVTYISPVIERLSKYRVGEILGRNMAEFIHPDDLPGLVENFSRTMKGIQEPYEYRVVDRDSTVRYVRSSSVITRKEGKVVGLTAIMTDITGRKAAEEAMRESVEKYHRLSLLFRLMADTMTDMLWAKDINREYIFVNQAICKNLLNAADTQEPLGKTDMYFATREREAHPENPHWHTFGEMCRDSDTITMQAQKPMQFDEFGNVRGEFLYLDVHKTPLYDDGGQLIGVVGSARDITDRKRAEEALQLSQNVLSETQRLTRAGGWEWDAVQHTMTWTDETYRIHGFSPGEIPAGSPEHIKRSIECYDPCDRPVIDAAFQRCWKEGSSYDMEFPLTKADGRRIWIQTIARPVMENDRVTRVIGTIMDITDHKAAEEEIQKQLAEKETLLREVHHRVKNNINAVASLLGISANEATGGEARAALLDARGRVMSMGKLYERLLLAGDYASMSVKSYMEELIAAIVELAPMKERPDVALSAEDLVLGVKQLFPLGLAVNELVTNALKYAFADGNEGRVEVSLARRGIAVTLTVRDNGKGIPEGFDPAESTGFGLKLVSMLAKQLGGTFTMRADSGTVCVLDFKTA